MGKLHPHLIGRRPLWTPPHNRSSKSRCSRASGPHNPTGHPALPGGRFCTIGNPLNDGTWTYTWEKGRQLKRVQSVDTDAQFVYNENGLRIQKTVNGVVTKYTLHGKNIVHMTQGNDTLHFYYDASNRPAMVEYNGVKYTYIYNLQSDVVAILNSDGTAVVKYRYDAWGKPISKTGDLASTLGTVQPFRYRAYVFDEETGLYYLRSRYYSCVWMRFQNTDCLIRAFGPLLAQNQYTYCENTPILTTDCDGCIPNPGLRTRIHNAVCTVVLANIKGDYNIGGFTGSGMKVVSAAGAVGYIDIVLDTSLVLEVKRYTCSAAKALIQRDFYLSCNWVGDSISNINRIANPEEYRISGSFPFEGYLVYYEEIAYGIVLYDYGASDDLDKLKRNVAEKSYAYEKAKQKQEETIVKICVAVGGAIGGAIAAHMLQGICHKILSDERYGVGINW